MTHQLLGVHCSVSGGLYKAFEEASTLDIDTFQIFTQNQRQWLNKTIEKEQEHLFKDAWKKSKVKIVFSHCSYLLNLASEESELRKKSVDALIGEVNRCHDLNLSFCVLHPGAAKNQTEEHAIAHIVQGLKSVLKATSHSGVKILLENTAGQGTSLGYRFEQLAMMQQGVSSDRIGVCLDTCHAFAAGYDLRTITAFDSVMESFDELIGLKHLHAIHLNDSKGELGCRTDRHEHIGKGKLGLAAFRYAMKHFSHLPKVMETEKDNNMDEVNLKVVRAL
ncbi:MAG: deoxyribonuclease IV [Bacteroidia bacterium]